MVWYEFFKRNWKKAAPKHVDAAGVVPRLLGHVGISFFAIDRMDGYSKPCWSRRWGGVRSDAAEARSKTDRFETGLRMEKVL